MANTSGLEKHEIIQIVAQIQGINQNISDLKLLQSLKNELINPLTRCSTFMDTIQRST